MNSGFGHHIVACRRQTCRGRHLASTSRALPARLVLYIDVHLHIHLQSIRHWDSVVERVSRENRRSLLSQHRYGEQRPSPAINFSRYDQT